MALLYHSIYYTMASTLPWHYSTIASTIPWHLPYHGITLPWHLLYHGITAHRADRPMADLAGQAGPGLLSRGLIWREARVVRETRVVRVVREAREARHLALYEYVNTYICSG